MIKKLIVLLLVCNCPAIYAQTIKTDVLVVGNGPSAVAAAVQSAHSKLKTVLAATEISIGDNTVANKMAEVDANRKLPYGTWGEFRDLVKNHYKGTTGYDTASSASLKFGPEAGSEILKSMTDTVKNLTVYLNAPFAAIKKDGDRWEVSLTQNEKTIYVKARVVIDATVNGEVAVKAGAKLQQSLNLRTISSLNSYRTSIATGDALPGEPFDAAAPVNSYPPYPAFYIPISAVVLRDADNILITEKTLPEVKDVQYLPLQLALGQGVGTVAAYCAFFKTTTQSLKVRIIQGELLDFKGYLLPFTDISQHDPYWRAIQQVCATGLLKGKQKVNGGNAQFVFMPDSAVTTSEVKPFLTEIYTRAFLWFNKEKTGEKFTVANTLSLISDYTLIDPLLLKGSMAKTWKSQYKFKQDFDLNRPITRREFAILINKFLNPFARTVDLSGRLVN